MVTIRPSRPDDAASLFEIWSSAVDATHHFLSAADKTFFGGLVRDRYLPTAPLLVAADEEDRPLAFLGMTGAKIDALFVAPTEHGRGIGRALIGRAARNHRCLEVDVNEQNEGAILFYERLGFRRVGRSARDDSGRPYPLLHLHRVA